MTSNRAFAAFQRGLNGIVATRHGQKRETILLGFAFGWPRAESSAATATTSGFDSRVPAIIAFFREFPGGRLDLIFRAGIRSD